MGKAKGKNRRERANRDRQQQQDLERRGVRTVTRKSKGGSTRSTEIDRFEVSEGSSSKGETMVELMKRMKEQYRAKEAQNNSSNNKTSGSRYGSSTTRVRTTAHSSSSSSSHRTLNTVSSGKVQLPSERVWNRGSSLTSKSRGSRSSRGSSLAGSDDENDEDDTPDDSEDEKSNVFTSRTRAPQQQRFEDDDDDDDEMRYSFQGTAGRRIDQAVMDYMQISRGRAKKLITAGKVSVDGRRLNPADKGLALQGGETVTIRGPVDGVNSAKSSTPGSPALSAKATPDDGPSSGGWDDFTDSGARQQPWSSPGDNRQRKGKDESFSGPVEKLCSRLLEHRRHWLVLPYTSIM
eukprot:CAMPEP_0195529610 /NCGR_PEP_ID=MMETSP0794_2-20130614/32216_1 /TAXON_ID=515487 /ORGANISM="Stephanopyxis turris, Strain CCMP 815" /LENGTH=348 /DNA_ID=CAMNT_0040660937 /DNA_START=91 /DNA_END=1137 /DNA_ORIENTATION=+